MKEKILGIITGIFYLTFLISSTGIESGSKVPVIMLIVSLTWFVLIVYANRDQLGPLEEYEANIESNIGQNIESNEAEK